MNNRPKVSIVMITYNQEKFVASAIQSILDQSTTFPFELIISDDNSSDKTQEIITSFYFENTKIIKPKFNKSNIGVIKNFYDAISRCEGEYIAYLDGDDYWTDPFKLQNQVEFLDSHPEFIICFTQTLGIYENSVKADKLRVKTIGNQSFDKSDLYTNCFMQLCSVMHRNITLTDFINQASQLKVGDWPLFTYLAQFGSIRFLDQITSVYRIHEKSVWNSFGELGALQVQTEVLEFFRDSGLFTITKELYDSLFMFYYKMAIFHHEHGENKNANQFLGSCFNLLRYTSLNKIRFFNSLFVQLKLPKVYKIRDRLR